MRSMDAPTGGAGASASGCSARRRRWSSLTWLAGKCPNRGYQSHSHSLAHHSSAVRLSIYPSPSSAQLPQPALSAFHSSIRCPLHPHVRMCQHFRVSPILSQSESLSYADQWTTCSNSLFVSFAKEKKESLFVLSMCAKDLFKFMRNKMSFFLRIR